MDRYTHDIGLAYMGDEPLYCEGPSPLHPDDIICLGSDDENDEASKVARRLRYEEQGRRYLQGRPLRIFSASLRGPFDKSSGWQNPWLPNLPSQRVQRLDRQSRSSVASPEAHYETDILVDRVSRQGDGTVQAVDDSLECHLPSPQSHQDLQFFNSPSHCDRRSRIELWAESVHRGFLEKDKFWAPGLDTAGREAESARKRPAGREWLKRGPVKRRRLPASQNTEATYASTPTPTTQLRAKSNRNPVIAKRPANRSFEMTTPSSSPERGPSEAKKIIEYQPAASHKAHGQPVLSVMPTRDTRTSCEPIISGREEEELEADNIGYENRTEAEYEEALEDEGRCHSPRQTSRNNGEPERSNDFENYADESFCYRARQLKQATPPVVSSVMTTDPPSQDTKYEAPVSPRHGDALIMPCSSDTHEPNLNAGRDRSSSRDVQHAKRPNDTSGSIEITNQSDLVSALKTDSSALQPRIDMILSCGIIDPSAATTNAARDDIGRQLGDITSSQHASRINILNNIPPTILEVKEARSISPEPFVDEGVTLIGDPMDMEKPRDIELVQQNPDFYSFEGSSLLQHYAISATNIANASQGLKWHDITIQDNGNDTEECAIPMRVQAAPVDVELMIYDNPTSQSPQEGPRGSDIDVEATLGQDNEGLPRVIIGHQAPLLEHQSPWAPLCTAKEICQSGNDCTEEGDDETGEFIAQPITKQLDSPVSTEFSPAIRPSQQSPWVQEAAKPIIILGLEGAVGMKATAVMTLGLPGTPSGPVLVEHQEHMDLASPLPMPPNTINPAQLLGEPQYLGSSIAKESEADTHTRGFPYTPVPQIDRQSTPDGEVSIRSFSNFNFSSPQRSLCPPSSSACRSILSKAKHMSMRTSTRSTRRVSFAVLPHEQEDDSNQLPAKSRAASPPPATLVDLEEEIVDGKYRNHFDVMNRRLSVHGTPTLRYHQRLLPSSSQQKPESPSVEAMANAFREADAPLSNHIDSVVQASKDDVHELRFGEVEETPQSPWQHDTQGTDDVAAVLGNLNQFLAVWDVDAEIDKNRAELSETRTHEASPNNDMTILQGGGFW
ncbi:hypothetical protein GGR55DRAFT_477053 [Xylaria sp. FL0064]|nr:hypothetical protein GGR55DRAFT_477053 [Xylaria sp. FL0064]